MWLSYLMVTWHILQWHCKLSVACMVRYGYSLWPSGEFVVKCESSGSLLSGAPIYDRVLSVLLLLKYERENILFFIHCYGCSVDNFCWYQIIIIVIVRLSLFFSLLLNSNLEFLGNWLRYIYLFDKWGKSMYTDKIWLELFFYWEDNPKYVCNWVLTGKKFYTLLELFSHEESPSHNSCCVPIKVKTWDK